MKVDRREAFEPIVITIESKEEADVLWHMLNVSTNDFNKKIRESAVHCSGDSAIQASMWSRLNGCYRPAEKF